MGVSPRAYLQPHQSFLPAPPTEIWLRPQEPSRTQTNLACGSFWEFSNKGKTAGFERYKVKFKSKVFPDNLENSQSASILSSLSLRSAASQILSWAASSRGNARAHSSETFQPSQVHPFFCPSVPSYQGFYNPPWHDWVSGINVAKFMS